MESSLINVVLVLILTLRISSPIFIEDPSIHSVYLHGLCHFPSSIVHNEESMRELLYGCENIDNFDGILHQHLSLRNTSPFAQISHNSDEGNVANEHALYKLSQALNACTVGKTNEEKEVLLQLAIAAYPWNVIAAKNLAFMYEWHGKEGAARDLYEACAQLTGDNGCKLHAAMLVPTLLWEGRAQSRDVVINALAALHRMVEGSQHSTPRAPDAVDLTSIPFVNADLPAINAPMSNLREMPLNIQYSGHSVNAVHEMFSAALNKVYPSLAVDLVAPTSASVDEGGASGIAINAAVNLDKRKVIRLGVVSEHTGNSSPGLCIQRILQHLIAGNAAARKQSHSNAHVIELIFFDRPHSATVFAQAMRAAAARTVTLNPFDLDESRRLVAECRLDILLYLALPTEKFTLFLSQARLAPVQVQFGLGHPISSGSRAVDYSVVTAQMLPPLGALTRTDDRARYNASSCARQAAECTTNKSLSDTTAGRKCGSNFPAECLRNSFQYSEQLVLFDSLGYFLEDPAEMYGGDADLALALKVFSLYRPPIAALNSTNNAGEDSSAEATDSAVRITCEYLDAKLAQWGLFPALTGRALGCHEQVPSTSPAGEDDDGIQFTAHAKRLHLYNAMHIVKKLHPLYDQALLGVLAADATAVIVGLESMRYIFPRLRTQLEAYNLSESDLTGRIILVPRIPHVEFLQLLALSSVYLNPFPFGSGITTSEALAMCVPVVVLPEETSVLHFAAGQLATLGDDLAELLTAHDIDSYVARAVDIAHGRVRGGMSLSVVRDAICARKERLFGAAALERAAAEWRTFIVNVVNVM